MCVAHGPSRCRTWEKFGGRGVAARSGRGRRPCSTQKSWLERRLHGRPAVLRRAADALLRDSQWRRAAERPEENCRCARGRVVGPGLAGRAFVESDAHDAAPQEVDGVGIVEADVCSQRAAAGASISAAAERPSGVDRSGGREAAFGEWAYSQGRRRGPSEDSPELLPTLRTGEPDLGLRQGRRAPVSARRLAGRAVRRRSFRCLKQRRARGVPRQGRAGAVRESAR
mmetsp:Transcript_17991/g.47097  ORF Transcript_17991/g.47097 Transcript_17991/m.47097 type:complete len:227 (+) Transcript_17991:212-892(+)